MKFFSAFILISLVTGCSYLPKMTNHNVNNIAEQENQTVFFEFKNALQNDNIPKILNTLSPEVSLLQGIGHSDFLAIYQNSPPKKWDILQERTDFILEQGGIIFTTNSLTKNQKWQFPYWERINTDKLDNEKLKNIFTTKAARMAADAGGNWTLFETPNSQSFISVNGEKGYMTVREFVNVIQDWKIIATEKNGKWFITTLHL